jgi:hypothetical protein
MHFGLHLTSYLFFSRCIHGSGHCSSTFLPSHSTLLEISWRKSFHSCILSFMHILPLSIISGSHSPGLVHSASATLGDALVLRWNFSFLHSVHFHSHWVTFLLLHSTFLSSPLHLEFPTFYIHSRVFCLHNFLDFSTLLLHLHSCSSATHSSSFPRFYFLCLEVPGVESFLLPGPFPRPVSCF